jgi:hypothetical protein
MSSGDASNLDQLLAGVDVTTDSFGLLIAYLLPGLAALWGMR